MPIASGFSIQRNDIIDVAHRVQTERQAANSATDTYILRSKPDFNDKDWEWDIRMGEVRVYLDRRKGNNIFSGSFTGSEINAWNENTYTEGSLVPGEGGVQYNSGIGEFGALVFSELARPISGETVEIQYVEAMEKFTGNDGGLLFQLAHDLCVHPYDSPEIFKLKFKNAQTLKITNVAGTAEDPITNGITGGDGSLSANGDNLSLFRNDLSVRYNHDYEEDGTPAIQREADKLWKLVTEHREVATVNLGAFSSIDPADATTYITLMDDFPLIESDLGSGEFRVAIDGRVLPRDDYTISSIVADRKSTFKLKRNPTSHPLTWVADLNSTNIVITYHWAKSLDVPFGALVGYKGMGPDQNGLTQTGGTVNPTDGSFPKAGADKDYWVYSTPVLAAPATTGINAFVGFPYDTGTNISNIENGQTDSLNIEAIYIGDLDTRRQNLAKVSDEDNFYISFTENDDYATPFNLIYPTPVSNQPDDVKIALRRITNKFLVESEKGVDLLSASDLNFVNSYAPSTARKPQKWRLRFEWIESEFSLKVNVATEYQLKDDMSISQPQGRDGIKSPVFREPGELCDVYKEPAIGKGANLQINTAKQQWFKRTKIVDEMSLSYPMSYRLTCTNHGMGLFLFDQASVDQDDDYAWFVVQRHVDQTTGQPEYTDKSPVHCVYSPFKPTNDVAGQNVYYATDDLEDLSRPPSIANSLGTIFKSEAPTIFIDRNNSIFNGYVNAVDFNSVGYATGAATGQNASQTDLKSDLYRSITGAGFTDSTTLWAQTTYTLQVDSATPNLKLMEDSGALMSGRYIILDISDVTAASITANTQAADPAGGRIISYNEVTKELVISMSTDKKATMDPLAPPTLVGTPVVCKIGISASGNIAGGGDFTIGNIAASSPNGTTGYATYGLNAPYTGEDTINLIALPSNSTELVVKNQNVNVTDLSITGYNQLPRRRDVSVVMNGSKSPVASVRSSPVNPTDPITLITARADGANFDSNTPAAATWVNTLDMAPSASGNLIFPEQTLQRMSTFKEASASGTGVPPVPENISLADYKEGDAALIDILYTVQPSNVSKVFESMVVALDDVEVERDAEAYVLTYDEWVAHGDPSTAGRFLQMLEAAGVDTLGANFKLPAENTTVPNFLGETTDGTVDSSVINFITNRRMFADKNTASFVITSGMLTVSTNQSKLNSLLPGDIVWTDNTSVTPQRNRYMYDYWNKSLIFKFPPRAASNFSISMINYTTSNPSQNSYVIDIPEDRNFPETNMNNIKTINRFVVREQDVVKPWDYHVSATMHEIDSHAIINPQEQLSITQDRNFVFSFPTQITSQRFYYPQSELDIICVSSADFSTQAGHVEINKYGDSDGLNGTFSGGNYIPTGITGDEQTRYAGHSGPDGEKYIWRKNARKYEGMVSTLPNGNGMRIFMQVTGSSIRYSDVSPGKAPGSVVGT